MEWHNFLVLLDLFLRMNSFRLFGLKRKSSNFCSVDGFIELRSRATEGKKDKNRVKKEDF